MYIKALTLVIHRNRNFDSGRNRYRNERLPAGTGTGTGIATGIQEFAKSLSLSLFQQSFMTNTKFLMLFLGIFQVTFVKLNFSEHYRGVSDFDSRQK